MVLIVPVGPIIWGLVWLFRSVSGSRNGGTSGKPGMMQRSTVPMSMSIGHVGLFLLVYLPGILVLTDLVGTATGSVSLGFLAFFGSFAAVVRLPRWLAWRVLGPAGWDWLGGAVLFVAPYLTLDAFRGNRDLFAAVYGRNPWRAGRRASAWILFAAAVRGEAEGRPDVAVALAELLPERRRRRFLTLRAESAEALPRRLRSQGVELLAWPAVERRDWPEAERRLASGRGRGVRLLRRLARAATEGGVDPFRLRLAWLLAPERRRTLPLVREALKRARGTAAPWKRTAPAEREGAAAAEGLWLRHLRLLEAAATGRPVRPAQVQRLAEEWEAALDRDAYLRLMRRGAELEVPSVQSVVELLPKVVEVELEDLAAVAEGPWPEPRQDGLAARVRQARLHSLFLAVETEIEPFRGRGFQDFGRRLDVPPVELERWLQWQRGLRRLRACAGDAEVRTAWYGGLRIAACNWPVYLLRTYGKDAAWACREMSRWSEALAVEMGDEEIAKLSRGNARVT